MEQKWKNYVNSKSPMTLFIFFLADGEMVNRGPAAARTFRISSWTCEWMDIYYRVDRMNREMTGSLSSRKWVCYLLDYVSGKMYRMYTFGRNGLTSAGSELQMYIPEAIVDSEPPSVSSFITIPDAKPNGHWNPIPPDTPIGVGLPAKKRLAVVQSDTDDDEVQLTPPPAPKKKRLFRNIFGDSSDSTDTNNT